MSKKKLKDLKELKEAPAKIENKEISEIEAIADEVFEENISYEQNEAESMSLADFDQIILKFNEFKGSREIQEAAKEAIEHVKRVRSLLVFILKATGELK